MLAQLLNIHHTPLPRVLAGKTTKCHVVCIHRLLMCLAFGQRKLPSPGLSDAVCQKFHAEDEKNFLGFPCLFPFFIDGPRRLDARAKILVPQI